MTNGEKIKEIFPSTDSRLDEKTGIILVKWVDGATKCFKADWWNAEYEDPIKALEQEPILDKIFCIVHPLSIMSTPELEHKAIMQIAEMLEPLCLPESEDEK